VDRRVEQVYRFTAPEIVLFCHSYAGN
ncbi:MAG: hypothetical protein EZS28_050497, partial [Streblomastix strix]